MVSLPILASSDRKLCHFSVSHQWLIRLAKTIEHVAALCVCRILTVADATADDLKSSVDVHPRTHSLGVLPYPHSRIFLWASRLSVSFDQTSSLAPYHVRTILSLFLHLLTYLYRRHRAVVSCWYISYVCITVVISYPSLTVLTQDSAVSF